MNISQAFGIPLSTLKSAAKVLKDLELIEQTDSFVVLSDLGQIVLSLMDTIDDNTSAKSNDMIMR